ncbi:YusG family protein [Fictibacillus iocasae]|uniref:YusG family protein n=1 Tax=Fictibacillus iocasae TaxID=2715437 RepID=A0ABW2NM84_9BACL
MQQNHPDRADVTSRVYGKLDGGYMSLFMDKESIGRIKFTNQGNHYEMAEGFEFENEKFYKKVPKSDQKVTDHFVDGCDKGWC